jgi:NitT/TauT family transport system ATP-binding protein
MSFITVSKLHKNFDKVSILQNLSFNVNHSEFISIFGPNGCGKTTLLNIIANLTNFDSGSININNKNTANAQIGFVFQKYSDSLFPWLKNIDNVAFFLKGSHKTKAQKHMQILNFAQSLNLNNLPFYKYPYQSSNGERQLITLIRELINKPDVLLMDEPFSALDYENRINLQNILLDIWQNTKTTIIFVSHEIDEAIYLSNKLILLSPKPTNIANIFNITLPYPRNFKLLKTKGFINLKNQILDEFIKITN